MARSDSELLHDIDDNLLQCSICCESFRTATPRILPCMHSYCEACLKKMIDNAGGKKITCPLCVRVYDLPKGLDSIPKNRLLNELSELVCKHDVKMDEEGKCGGCQKENTTSHCIECKVDFCDGCTQAHNTQKATGRHLVIPILDYENLRRPSPDGNQSRACCSTHPLHHVTLYCDSCEMSICFECTEQAHVGREHKYRILGDAASENKEDLKEMLENLKEKKHEAKLSRQEVKEVSKSLEDRFQGEEKKLDKHIEKTIRDVTAKIKENGHKLKDKMKQEYLLRMKKLEAQAKELEIAENDLKHEAYLFEKLLLYGTLEMLMEAKKGMKSQIEQLIASNTNQKPVAHNYIEFKHSDVNLEKVDLGAVDITICKIPLFQIVQG